MLRRLLDEFAQYVPSHRTDPAEDPRLTSLTDREREILVAVNLCLEGLLQPFQRELYHNAARAQRDMGSAMLGRHCWIDEERHLAWTDAFLRLAVESEPANRAVIDGWHEIHAPAAHAALDALAAGFPFDGAAEAAAVARTELTKRLEGI